MALWRFRVGDISARRILELDVCAARIAQARRDPPAFDITVLANLKPQPVLACLFRFLRRDTDRQPFVFREHLPFHLSAFGHAGLQAVELSALRWSESGASTR